METLNVFFRQTRVGFLIIDDRRLFSFQYSKEWLTSPDAFQISISLPMQEDILKMPKHYYQQNFNKPNELVKPAIWGC
ncbi:MAG: hypothetical protein GY707_10435 [Desulfobacteraceae bacterium]|nr:hypothetical protein [Desulfobacteraceae bacterium]